ncbi:YfiR family protein [Bowmanella denitrificans]|uniref:YfiR family protein n=1 Tax=Bowmanella denitrificans TaxID=366582 RepID=UPI0015589E99|nr:YfiR family protein [Bowmanella denitrificans]
MRLMLLFLMLLCPCHCLASGLSQNQLKAAFLYRFSQFSTWPPPPKQEMVYCVVGNPSLFNAVSELLSTQPSKLKSKVVTPIDSKEAQQCQLLFISQQDRQQSLYWLEGVKDSAVLVVADTSEGFRQGAAIGLIADNNSLNFSINLTDARARGLELSAHLLKLATEVR